MRIVDFKPGRQIVGDDDAAELRLGFRHPQHHDHAAVLLHLFGVERIAVERVGLALDLEALFRRGLRRHRRAGNRHDRLHRLLAGICHAQRLLEVAGADGAVERARRRRRRDIERHLAGILRHGARREQKPRVLLRRGRAQIGGTDSTRCTAACTVAGAAPLSLASATTAAASRNVEP